MKIEINNHRKIFAIQEEFNSMFPGLTLAFYAKPSNPGAAPSTKLIRHSGKTLQDCRSINKEGAIEILPSMNIMELKNYFRDVFGLSVEIFQKGEQGANKPIDMNNLTLEEISKQSIV
jgi:hypothetical protein